MSITAFAPRRLARTAATHLDRLGGPRAGDPVGLSATGAEPDDATPAHLAEILPFPTVDPGVVDDESRRLMDNYFRIMRRCDDLRTTLADAGTPLPTDTEWRRGLDHEVSADPTTKAALALIPTWVHWCADQTGLTPDLAERAYSAATG